MRLQLRLNATYYDVDVPDGSRLVPSSAGRQVLLIPGANLGDTCTWVPAHRILEAARLGQHGLCLLGERRAAEPA